MAIRQWHPIKLGIIWAFDLTLLVVLRLFAHPARRDDQAWAIIIWLILSIPVFVITWKWASGREARFLPGYVSNPNEHVPLPARSTGVRVASLPVPFLHKASPELTRALVLQSNKDHKILKIKGTDGAEMDVAVRYEMHPYHWENFGPCFMAIRHPEKRGAKRVWEQIKYNDIAELAILNQKYALRFRLEDYYKRITESKLCGRIYMLAISILLIMLCGGFAAMVLAGFVSNLLSTSYMTAFWWIAGTISTVFLLWILRPGGRLLEPDGPMEGEPRAFFLSLYSLLLGSIPLFIFASSLLHHTIQTLGLTSAVLFGIAVYWLTPESIRDRSIRKALSTSLGNMALLLAGLLIFAYAYCLNYLGEQYNPTLQGMMNLPAQENQSEQENQ